MKKYRTIFKLFLVVSAIVAFAVSSFISAEAKPPKPTPTPSTTPQPYDLVRAGLRSSDYGISPFPSPTWWVNSINSMAGSFSEKPAGSSILVVVEIDGMSGPGCWAHFPNPDGRTYPGVRFDATDEFEPLLDAFDKPEVGIKAWVQVESSGCDMTMLINLVMGHYGSHPSVVGFGVDDEWYLNKSYQVGKPITDAEARDWVGLVRSFDSSDKVFLKHWLTSQMPPTYRDGIVFINDSQGLRSLSAMVTDFAAWGQYFYNAPVGFQYGYARDKKWWGRLSNPPKTIGDAIRAATPNTTDLYWVDFTAYDIWPPTP